MLVSNCCPYYSQIFNTIFFISQLSYTNGLYKQRDPKGRYFLFYHCWALLKNNEKWKNKDNDHLHPNKKAKTNAQDSDDDDVNVEDQANITPMSHRPWQKGTSKDRRERKTEEWR